MEMHCWYLEARRMAAAKSVHIIYAEGPHNMYCKGLVLEALAKIPIPTPKVHELTSWEWLDF